MSADNPVIATSLPLISLPVALYESNGVVFELYRGGRAYHVSEIRWQRLKTFTVSREGDLTFNVRVSQAHLKSSAE